MGTSKEQDILFRQIRSTLQFVSPTLERSLLRAKATALVVVELLQGRANSLSKIDLSH